MLRFLLTSPLVLAAFVPAWAYDYPFKNPYEATVLGTLPGDQYPLESIRPAGLGDLNPLRREPGRPRARKPAGRGGRDARTSGGWSRTSGGKAGAPRVD